MTDCERNVNLIVNDCLRNNFSEFLKLETIVEKGFIKIFLYMNMLRNVFQPQGSPWPQTVMTSEQSSCERNRNCKETPKSSKVI